MAETSRIDDFDRDISPLASKKQWISLALMVGLIIAFYAGGSVLINLIGRGTRHGLEVGREGANEEWETVEMIPLEFDMLNMFQDLFDDPDFLDALMDYLDGLSPEEQEEFLENFENILGDISDSLNGGDFDPSMFDDIPPELMGAVLAKLVYHVYPHPDRTWSNEDETFFRSTAHDRYDLTDYNWITATAQKQEDVYMFDAGSDRMFKIKMPVTTEGTTKVIIPTLFPEPRIQDYSLSSSPAVPDGNNQEARIQVSMQGVYYNSKFSGDQVDVPCNISYWLLQSPGDRHPDSWYESNSVDVNAYSSSKQSIYTAGPRDGSTTLSWAQYRSNNPNFDAVVTAIESDPEYIGLNTAYEKIEFMLDYIGQNFALDPFSSARPGDNEDPIEWYAERGVTNYPFEVTGLTVATARALGIAARYTIGYRWNEALASEMGGSFNDPGEDGKLAYPFRIGNTYTWPEFFIPTGSSEGEWMEKDNRINLGEAPDPGEGDPEDLPFTLNVKYDGEWEPDFEGYSRIASIDMEFNYTELGTPVQGKQITIRDATYDNITIGTTTTNAQGLADFTLEMDDLESGPHVLTYSVTYGQEVVANGTIISVVDNVDLYLEPIEPDPVNASEDTSRQFTAQGYCWDPHVDRPVRNAIVELSLFVGGDLAPGGILDPTRGTTDENGNFTIDTRLSGDVLQGTHTVRATFPGAFDLSHIEGLGGMDYIATHAPAYIQVEDEDITLVDPDQKIFNFWINGTAPTDYLIVDRQTDTINITAYTEQGGEPVGGTIEITDYTTGLTLGTFNTQEANGGYGSWIIESGDLINEASFWSVGPRCIEAEWIQGEIKDPSQSTWVIIQDTTELVITSPTTAGSYDLGTPGDSFTLSGYVQDAVTDEKLNNYVVNYNLYDASDVERNDWLSAEEFYLLGSSAIDFQQSGLYFTGDANPGSVYNPYYIQVSFDGIYYLDGQEYEQRNWNPSWNQGEFMSPTVASQENSADLTVTDPEDRGLYLWVNGTAAHSSYNSANLLVVEPGETANLTVQWRYQTLFPEGETVTLRELTSNQVIDTGITDGDGYYQFILPHDGRAGIYRFRVSVQNGSSVVNDTIVMFNNSINIESNISGYDSETDQIIRDFADKGDTVTVTGSLKTYTEERWVGAEIGITILDEFGTSHQNWIDGVTTQVLTYSDNGEFTFAFKISGDAMVGEHYISVYFTGQFVSPGTPSLDYSNSALERTADNETIVVNASSSLTTNYEFDPPESYSYGDTLRIWGALTYDNGTFIEGEDVYIEVLDANWNTVDSALVQTNATIGDNYGYEFTINYPQISRIRVTYQGNSVLFLTGDVATQVVI